MTKIIGLQSNFGFSKKLFAVPTFQSGFLIFFRLEKLLNDNKLCFGFQKYIGVVFYRLQQNPDLCNCLNYKVLPVRIISANIEFHPQVKRKFILLKILIFFSYHI